MDWTTLQTAVHTWAEGATGLTAVWANQNVPRPAYPFVVLNINSVEPVAPDYLKLVDASPGPDDFDACVIGERLMTLNAQAFTLSQVPNANGRYYLELMKMALRLPDTKQALRDVNMGIANTGPLTQLDDVIEGAWQSRWSLDFSFNTVVTLSSADPVGEIKSVELTNEINDPDTMFTITGA